MGTSIAFIVILFIVALLLEAFELLTPTFGVLAFLALLAYGGAVWVGFTISTTVGVFLIAAVLVIAPTFAIFFIRGLQQWRVGRQLFLERPAEKAGSGLLVADENEKLVGKTGVADTFLRPAGAVRVEGKRVHARAESGMIEKGATVRIIAAGATDVVVRRVEKTE